MNDRVGPLKGVRVLDITQALAGPYCTMLLADLGANVIKVESGRGEMTRFSGPFTDDDSEHAFGGYYASLNRNKRSLVLDLKSSGGKEAIMRLAEKSEVLVENFAAGVMDRLGLAYETLADRNPRLVYAAIRGFGDPRTGASQYTDWPAYDIVAQAMGGLVGVTGTADGHGLRCGPSVGDIMPGTLATVGILAAVLHARETGEGQFLDVAMYDAVLSLCEHYVYLYSYTGENPRPLGNAHPFLCPFDVFDAKDGQIAIAAPTDKHWRLLCDIIGRPELGRDERYAKNEGRQKHAPEIRAIIGKWTAQRTRDEIVDTLSRLVPTGPVNTMADIFEDPHTTAREMLPEIEQVGARPVKLAGQPIKLTRTPSRIYRRAPVLGEDNDEILAEIGMSLADLAASE
ncbi:MAG: CoA transferase [Chloroflexi bacterium]|nr:MAG: CoA transferase [Chloroflexota bacterium]